MKKLLNKKGFTIVELVIVIAVIAILAAVLIPTFSNVVDSAKETATLQEAKGTLDSYIGVMSSNGDSLPDGTVFIVYENDTAAETNQTLVDKKNVSGAYVYYKGALHKFDYKSASNSISAEYLPAAVDNATNFLKTFKLPKVSSTEVTADTYISWTDEQIKDFSATKNFYFAYNQFKPVDFNGGSTKCRIYSGAIVSIVTELTLSLKDGENELLTDAPASNIYSTTLTITADKVLKLSAKTIVPENSSYKVQIDNESADYATVNAENEITIKTTAKGKTVVINVTAGTLKRIIKVTVSE